MDIRAIHRCADVIATPSSSISLSVASSTASTDRWWGGTPLPLPLPERLEDPNVSCGRSCRPYICFRSSRYTDLSLWCSPPDAVLSRGPARGMLTRELKRLSKPSWLDACAGSPTTPEHRKSGPFPHQGIHPVPLNLYQAGPSQQFEWRVYPGRTPIRKRRTPRRKAALGLPQVRAAEIAHSVTLRTSGIPRSHQWVPLSLSFAAAFCPVASAVRLQSGWPSANRPRGARDIQMDSIHGVITAVSLSFAADGHTCNGACDK